MTMTVEKPIALELTRHFDAPPEQVFAAWLDKSCGDWMGPPGVKGEVAILEPVIGGRYHLVMHISGRGDIPVEGVFKTIDRPSPGKMGKFAFTWGWALSGHGDTLVSVSLKDLGGKTELTLTHEGLPTAEDREGHGRGWNSTLNKLERYLKGERT